ncbi:hypothetical protein ACFL1X_08600 [Candidatus Hydrogenedentota bacterium]
MFRSNLFRVAFLFALLGGLCTPAFAQWSTQSITLRPGWNAVFLEVKPQPDRCEAVFAGMPIKSVWAWNKRFSSVQFIQDIDTLVPEQEEWLTYIPAEKPDSFVTNLFTLTGGKAYLIELGGAETIEWAIPGEPVVRTTDWMGDSFNLVGFFVDSSSPPVFEDFLAPSSAHVGQPVYKLNDLGKWDKIEDLASAEINTGEAYWVYCEGQSKYSGPLSLTVEQAGRLDYGRVLNEQTLRVKNETSSGKQISLSMGTSEAPPSPTFPVLAGATPLSYWKTDFVNSIYGWITFPEELQISIPAGKELVLRLAVRRKDMAPFTPPEGARGASYQSLMEISDGEGYRVLLPVSAKSATPGRAEGSSLRAMAGPTVPPNPRAGLWTGVASIDKVSYPADVADPYTPKPTASEIQIRLIIHVDADGQAKLLQQALLMWKEGVVDSETGEVVVPGRYVLLTTDDENVVSQFSGVALRDGDQVGRRISTAAFSFREPVSMIGELGAGGDTLTCTLTIDADDPLNPFKHRYHPDHDNVKSDFTTTQAEGVESFTAGRAITLDFSDADPEGLEFAGWGDSMVGGTYKEAITGIYSRFDPTSGSLVQELNVEGVFRLQRISLVPELNDGGGTLAGTFRTLKLSAKK